MLPDTRHLTPITYHPPIILREFESREVELPAQVYSALRRRYSGKLSASPTDTPGLYRIVAHDYVGRVSLPGGLLLVVQPKAPLNNLFYMLCADPRLAEFMPPPASLAPDTDIFPFVISAFITAVEKLLSQGLRLEHAPHQEDLPFVRGRILLGPQFRMHGDLRHRQVCSFAELTEDTRENRIVAASLRYLPALLRSGGEADLLRKARALLARFQGVRIIDRALALQMLPTVGIHRLNSAYGPVLALCRLILNHLTLDEAPGPHPFASFLVNMPRLFESFIASRLHSLLPRHGFRTVAQPHDYLDEARMVSIRPDVLVYPRDEGGPVLVLDTKYRDPADPQSDLNRDLYQVSAYLDRFGLRQGVLVYPQFEVAAHNELKLRGTGKRLHVMTVNLAARDSAALEQNCILLAAEVSRLASLPG
jgi:5-methylcytosine-specific restriction enzyme subunit McrC